MPLHEIITKQRQEVQRNDRDEEKLIDRVNSIRSRQCSCHAQLDHGCRCMIRYAMASHLGPIYSITASEDAILLMAE